MRKKRSAFQILVNVTLLVAALVCVLPILNILALSLSSSSAVAAGKVSLLPVDFTVATYQVLIKGTRIVQAFLNSVCITVVGVILNMSTTIITAYPLSKPYMWGRRFFTKMAVFCMMFSGGMIPTYLVIHKLNLIDSYWSIWLCGLISTYNMLVMRSFFEGIPVELSESAQIDGANEIQMLFRIYLPLSKPVLATLLLFYGVGHWNNFMDVMLYITSSTKTNLSVFVYQMVQSQQALTQLGNVGFTAEDFTNVASTGIRSAAVFIMIVPMLCVYPFVQKYFVKGVMLGAVKG